MIRERLYLKGHDKVAIGIFFLLACDSSYDDRGKRRTKIEGNMFFSHDREYIEKKLGIEFYHFRCSLD